MTIRFTLSLALLGFTFTLVAQSIKSPDDYLGYRLGDQFTFHQQVIDYFNYVSETSPLVQYLPYGKTYEDRPLGVAFVSSEENLDNLELLRKNNLINIGLLEGEEGGKQVPFIWLSYNVHGNESVGMEAALKTLFVLANQSHEGVDDWLKECVIVIDPCQNPDGRDLYTYRYRRSKSVQPSANPDDWEHHQDWPSARLNHYLFDLNRDWTWQTQAETRQRLRLYNQYMPHVHADFHEMGASSTFFFAPGADPWHEVITPWQREFHEMTGKANAALFDEQFKLYFTKESFDLFCPSFGDTWPLFNGAMGFTYEQGGGGYSGLSIARETGDTLSLHDRIDGHFLASLATIQVSYENREKLITEFNAYFKSGLTKPPFEYESVIIKGDNDHAAIQDLIELLDRNQIRYSFAGNIGKTYTGFEYLANKNGQVTIDEGDILVAARQPQSHFIKVLFEPDSKYTDSLSYDLTAWSLPYVYNLRVYALKEIITPKEGEVVLPSTINALPDTKPYAYIVSWSGFGEVKFMAELLKRKIRIRNAMKPFTAGKQEFGRGSLIIARGDNKHLKESFDQTIITIANGAGIRLHPTSTGIVAKGKDLGSNYAPLKSKPEIALVGGDGVSSGSFGELWYLFEREINYPLTVLGTDYLNSVDLSKYDVLLLPSGSYATQKDKLLEYVKEGGRLVAFERAISLFAEEKTTNLYNAVEARKKEVEAEKEKIKTDDPSHLKKYENQRRERLKERSAGSIYRVDLDETHPYVFGLGEKWFVMKMSANYPFLDKGNNIGFILNNEPVAGFAGSEFQKEVKNSLVIGSERLGSGEIVYITDDPYYRAYWKSGRVLLGNVVFR
jgi:hypothetical protein